MKSFEDIMNNIDTLVSEGKLSEESANSIADSFYERYMTEANAYNKAVDIYNAKGPKKIKEANDLNKKAYQLTRRRLTKDRPTIDMLEELADKKRELAKEDARKLGLTTNPKIHSQRKSPNANVNYNKGYASTKSEWMRDHGNTGVSPEKKYKAGRYLELQKIAKESSLEDEINGLGIACEAGLISEDFLPILLEAVDPYLE